MTYKKTKDALAAYDAEPTSGNMDLVRVSFWLEAPTRTRGRLDNPTVGEIRAAITLEEQHELAELKRDQQEKRA